jgi:hypothetical protein
VANASGNGSGRDEAGDEVRSALRNRAERIPLRALEKRGFRSVQVLDMATIQRVVGEAVTHLVERHTALLSTEDKAKLEVEARAEFSKLIAEHKKAVAEKTEAERARDALERQMQGLREEIERQKGDLAKAHAKDVADHTFTLSPESYSEMELKIRGLFAQLVSSERRVSLAEAGPRALKGLNELEQQVASLLDRLLATERDRFIGSVKRQQSEEVGVLEKRIAKLNKALGDTESALQRMSKLKAGDPGIASIYAEVQGLSSMDAYYARKKEVLELIFQENLKIQKRDGTAAPAPEGEAEAAAAPPPAPIVRAQTFKANPEDLGFEPPLEPVSDETAF